MTISLYALLMLALTITGDVIGVMKQEYRSCIFWFWNVVCWAIVLTGFHVGVVVG